MGIEFREGTLINADKTRIKKMRKGSTIRKLIKTKVPDRSLSTSLKLKSFRLANHSQSDRCGESHPAGETERVSCVWVLFSGTMTHSFSSEAATKARKGTQERLAYHALCSRINRREILIGRPSRRQESRSLWIEPESQVSRRRQQYTYRLCD